MEAVPLWPSLVAVMVAEPAALAPTSPLPFTVATPELLFVQEMVRPVSGFPFASFGVAMSCCVPPTVRLAVAGLTATEATRTFETEMEAVPLRPSLTALMVVEPAATLVTSPLPFTNPTLELLLAHVTVRPVNTFPAESKVVAASCAVCPTSTLADAGLIVTAETGTGVTVTTAVSVEPPGLPWAITFTFPVSEPAL